MRWWVREPTLRNHWSRSRDATDSTNSTDTTTTEPSAQDMPFGFRRQNQPTSSCYRLLSRRRGLCHTPPCKLCRERWLLTKLRPGKGMASRSSRAPLLWEWDGLLLSVLWGWHP